MANSNLHNAKRAKQDEFYTQWEDIEREMNAYLEYDPNVFRGKTILLPCDDPEWSNFTKYFVSRFAKLGIKKLISTSYNSTGRGRILTHPGKSHGWEYLEGDGFSCPGAGHNSHMATITSMVKNTGLLGSGSECHSE